MDFENAVAVATAGVVVAAEAVPAKPVPDYSMVSGCSLPEMRCNYRGLSYGLLGVVVAGDVAAAAACSLQKAAPFGTGHASSEVDFDSSWNSSGFASAGTSFAVEVSGFDSEKVPSALCQSYLVGKHSRTVLAQKNQTFDVAEGFRLFAMRLLSRGLGKTMGFDPSLVSEEFGHSIHYSTD